MVAYTEVHFIEVFMLGMLAKSEPQRLRQCHEYHYHIPATKCLLEWGAEVNPLFPSPLKARGMCSRLSGE